jgi:hypothetical protein
MVKGISFWKQTFLKRILIHFFGKYRWESDLLFRFEGKVYKGIFYYYKQHHIKAKQMFLTKWESKNNNNARSNFKTN